MPISDPPGQTARHSVRQAGGLALQRLLLIASSIAAVSLIPRVMGPQVYGQFSLIHSISLWFALLNGMGAVSMMTRFVPEFLERQDFAGLRRLAGGMLTLRVASGFVSGLVYFALTSLWLRDLDPVPIALVAVSIILRTAANLPFTLLLGLNQASRWGAAELVRYSLHAPLVFAGYKLAGLRGGCASLTLVELAVLALGLWWTRGYIPWSSLRVDRQFLRPFVRFSAGFLVSNLLIVLFDRGGGPLLHLLSGDYKAAGYFTLATNAYLITAGTAWRLLSAFGPLLSTFRSRGATGELARWVEGILKTLAVGAVLGLALVYTCGAPMFRWIVGPGYESVEPLLPTLALAGVAFGPGAVARLLAVCYGESRVTIQAATLQVVVFVTCSLSLIPRLGTHGAILALVLAVLFFAAFSTWKMQQHLAYSLRQWGQVVLLGAFYSPLCWAWEGPAAVRFASFALGFLATLAQFRIFSAFEFAQLWRQPAK